MKGPGRFEKRQNTRRQEKTSMKSWGIASAWIFAILCAANGGITGFFGGLIIGYAVGVLLAAAATLFTVAVRLVIWAGLLGVAALLLSS